MRNCLTLPRLGCTGCCRGSMETTHTTMVGRTWMEELRVMLRVRVVGIGCPHNLPAGIPRPKEKWGATLWTFCQRSVRGT